MAKTVGVALGGGGAKGLAHIAVLQTLDEMGVKVSALAGTSIGAIVGSGYASGKSGNDLRAGIDQLLEVPRNFEQVKKTGRLFGWLDLLGVEFGKSHVLEANAFIAEMETYVGAETFEELGIPLKVVAADFWKRREVVLEIGRAHV